MLPPRRPARRQGRGEDGSGCRRIPGSDLQPPSPPGLALRFLPALLRVPVAVLVISRPVVTVAVGAVPPVACLVLVVHYDPGDGSTHRFQGFPQPLRRLD